MSDETNEIPWIGVRDPEGVVHMLGDTGEDSDWTECLREFTTVGGWRGVDPDEDIATVCAKCAEAVIAIYRMRLGMTYSFVTSTETPTIVITDCTFGAASGGPEQP